MEIELQIGDKISIGNTTVITFVGIVLGQAKLGIDAPRDVPIFREELLKGGQKPPCLKGKRRRGRHRSGP